MILLRKLFGRASNAQPPGLLISLAVNVALNGEDGWKRLAPYGRTDYWEKQPDGLWRKFDQIFTKTQALEMVASFNSAATKPNFSGLSIFIGHPDADSQRWPDDRRLGKIVECEAREDALWVNVKWNDLGRKNAQEGYYVYPSPAWLFPKAIAAQTGQVLPNELQSVGLTNTPNIKDVDAWTNTAPAGGPEQHGGEGHWITINGAHVLLRDGESVEGALHRNALKDEPDDKTVPSVHTLRDPSGKAHSVAIKHDGKHWVIENQHGESLGRKFTSRDDAKTFVSGKLQKEINRRYEQAVKDGTVEEPKLMGEAWVRQRQHQAEAQSQSRAWADFLKKRTGINSQCIKDVDAWTNTAPAGGPEPITPQPEENTDMKHKATLLKLLGLPDDATDEQIDTACNTYCQKQTDDKAALDDATKKKTDADTAANTAQAEAQKFKSIAIQGALATAINSGRITAAEKDGWETKLAANFDTANSELSAKQPALNTQSLNLQPTGDQGDLSTPHGRQIAFNSAIDERMRPTSQGGKGITNFDTAIADIRSTPEGAALLKAMGNN